MLSSRVFYIFFYILASIVQNNSKKLLKFFIHFMISNICRQDSNNRIFSSSFYSHNRLVRASIVAYIAISRFRSIQKKSRWLLSFMFGWWRFFARFSINCFSALNCWFSCIYQSKVINFLQLGVVYSCSTINIHVFV